MTKNQMIAAVKSADINQTDWAYCLIERCPLFARGYLTACMSYLTNSLDTSTEEFRDDLLEKCGHEIWNVQ